MSLPLSCDNVRLIAAYVYRPQKDERLSWPSWLTYSRWITHISGHQLAVGQAQDMESSLVKDRRSTTAPRNQLSGNSSSSS